MPVNDGYWNMFSPCDTRPIAASANRIGASPPKLASTARAPLMAKGAARHDIALAIGTPGRESVGAGVQRLFPGVYAAYLSYDRAQRRVSEQPLVRHVRRQQAQRGGMPWAEPMHAGELV